MHTIGTFLKLLDLRELFIKLIDELDEFLPVRIVFGHYTFRYNIIICALEA